jgi:hypothetical protein
MTSDCHFDPLLSLRVAIHPQPANDFNKPKVDLGPAALQLRPAAECATAAGGTGSGAGRAGGAGGARAGAALVPDGADDALRRAVELVRPRDRARR